MIRRRRDRLIVFTRYPVPGIVKTRLIPALGAQGAAEMQRRMTGYTLEQVRRFLRDEPVGVEVRWDGGDRERIRTWLGEDLLYVPQGGGDLGQRMDRAFREAFGSGVRRAVLIGTDCPAMGPEILREAFRSLRRTDAVLGPARDGGYYLIGLSKPEPELFQGVVWGSERVLARTREIARARGLRVGLLEPLPDVDRPEDLPVWEESVRRSGFWGAGGFRLSIVLPTLDEAEKVTDALESTQGAPSVMERIVVDGGSRDDTVARAAAWGARVISSPPGRAVQMNAGARAAQGNALLFLHADTRLPHGFEDHVHRILSGRDTVAGAFLLAIDGGFSGYRVIERLANFRSRRLGIPYGDQGIFLRADRFRELGGFPEIPVMEDFELMRRLRRLGRVETAPAAAVSSSRRYRGRGLLRTTFLHQMMIVGYLVGVPPRRLAAWYRTGPGGNRAF